MTNAASAVSTSLVLYHGITLVSSSMPPDAVAGDDPVPIGANKPPPPVGPLPDALLDDAECSSSSSGIEGACDAEIDQIELFFASLPNDDECIDESDECSDFAASGMCMTDMEEMLEYGCYWSCLYCQVPSSAELFSLGVDQVFDYDDEEDRITRVPSKEEVTRRIDQTVAHMINTVLVQDDHKAYRLSCRNFKPQCSYWAESGWCDTYEGWMGKNCPAACFTCPLVDNANRCPIDEDSNAIQPGDMNEMYERWLSEAGVDVSMLSLENPPPTSVDHPLGKLTVVSSPYYDMTTLLADDEDEDDESPLPWVIAIEDFLTGEECDVLIKHGAALGYEQSEEYSDTVNVGGTQESAESESRTSTNTFCDDGCEADPIVRGVIDRIVGMTNISANHYEPLQVSWTRMGAHTSAVLPSAYACEPLCNSVGSVRSRPILRRAP